MWILRSIRGIPNSLNKMKSKKGKCHCNVNEYMGEEEIQKNILELRYGEAKIINLNESVSNFVKNLGLIGIFFTSTLSFFLHLSHLWHFAVIVAVLSDEELQGLSSGTQFYAFALYYLVYVGYDFYLEYKVYAKRKQLIKNCTVQKINFNSLNDPYTPISQNILQIGDIILLNRNDLSPADVLILDMKDNSCVVDSRMITGRLTLETKKAHTLTAIEKNSKLKGNLAKYRKLLNAKIEYWRSASGKKWKISGYFKLKKNPRGENLDPENIIMKGSEIKHTDWVIGLVLYNKADCLINDFEQYRQKKATFIDKKLEIYSVIILVFIFFLSIFSITCYQFYIKNDQFFILVPSLQSNVDGNGLEQFIFLYSFLMPLNIYFIRNIFYMYYTKKLRNWIDKRKRMRKSENKKFSQVPINAVTTTEENLNTDAKDRLGKEIEKKINIVTSESGIEILDPRTFSDASKLDWAIYSANALSSGVFEVMGFTVGEKFVLTQSPSSYDSELIASQHSDLKMNSGQNNAFSNGMNFTHRNSIISEEKSILSQMNNQNDFINIKMVQSTGQANQVNSELDIPLERSDEEVTKKSLTMDQSEFKFDNEEKILEPGFTEFINENHPQIFRFRSVENYQVNMESSDPGRERDDKKRNTSPQHLFNNLKKFSNSKGNSSRGFTQPRRIGSNLTFSSYIRTDAQEKELIFKCLALCHSAKSRINRSDNTIINEFTHHLDTALVKFAEKNDYQFEALIKNNSTFCYKVKINNKSKHFPVLGINEFTRKRNKMSVVLKEPGQNEGSSLYIKGYDKSIIDKLNVSETERDGLKDFVDEVVIFGFMVVILAWKPFTEEQTEVYIKRSQIFKTSVTFGDEDTTNYLNSLENGLNLISVVCYKEVLKDGVEKTITDFNSAHIYQSLLNSQGEARSLALAYSSGILDKFTDIYKVKGNDEDSVMISIRAILNKMKKGIFKRAEESRLSKKIKDISMDQSIIGAVYKMNPHGAGSNHRNLEANNYERSDSYQPRKGLPINNGSLFPNLDQQNSMGYFIILDGPTFEAIINNETLLAHFGFITYYARGLIGYHMNEIHRRNFVKYLKRILPDYPIVLACGEGYSDSLMFQMSDLSIEIGEIGKCSMSSEIVLHDFSFLSKLVFVHAVEFSQKLHSILNHAFYACLLININFFYFCWYSNFSATPLIEPYVAFSLHNVVIYIPIVIYSIFPLEGCSELLWSKFPSIYNNRNYGLKHFVLNFFIVCIIFSIIESVFIFMIVLFCSPYEDGNLRSLDITVILIYLSLYISLNSKLIVLTRVKFLWGYVIGLLISMIICGLYLYSEQNNFMNKQNLDRYLLNILEVFTHGYSFLIFLFVSTIVGLWHYFVSQVFDIKSYNTNFKKLRQILKTLNVIPTNSDTVISNSNRAEIQKIKTREVHHVIRHMFKNKKIDLILQDMINPQDYQRVEKGYDPYTFKFRNKHLNQEFELSNHKKIRKTLRFYLLFVVVILLCSLIGHNFTIKSPLKIVEGEEIVNLRFYFSIAWIVFLLLAWLINLNQRFFVNFLKYLNFLVPLISSGFIVAHLVSPSSHLEFIYGLYILVIHLNFIGVLIEQIHIKTILNSFFFILAISLIFSKSPRYFTTDIVNFQIKNSGDEEAVNYYEKLALSLFIFMIFALQSFLFIKREKSWRDVFLAQAKLKIQNKKLNDILSILVPKFIKDHINEGEYTLSEDQGFVSIMFCDICEFDKVIAEETTNVVKLLDTFFKTCDMLCLQHGVQKIETVGKTYMACAGLKASDFEAPMNNLESSNSTKKVLHLAIDIMQSAKNITWGEEGNILKLKIGIHYGPVIAGVIGHHKPQFSLIGDTVNTTSRVCSTGDSEKITISYEAYNEINYLGLNFSEIEVEAKGKGIIKTYQLMLKESYGNEPSPNKFQKRNANFVRKGKRNDKKNGTLILSTANFKKRTLLIPSHVEEEKNFSKIVSSLLNNNKIEDKVNERPVSNFDENKRSRLKLLIEHETNELTKKNIPQSHDDRESKEELIESIELRPGRAASFARNMPDQSQKHLHDTSADIIDEVEKEVESFSKENEFIEVTKFWQFFKTRNKQINENFVMELYSNFDKENVGILSIMTISLIMHAFLIIIFIAPLIDKDLLIITLVIRFTCALVVLFLILVRKRFFNSKSYKFVLIFFILLALGEMLNHPVSTRMGTVSNANDLDLILMMVCLTNLSFVFFYEMCLISSMFIVVWVILRVYYSSQDVFIELLTIIFTIVSNLYFVREKMAQRVTSFNNLSKCLTTNSQRNILMRNLLPSHLLEKFLRNPSNKFELIDVYQNVTILFADIAGFTKYSSSVAASQVVSMLRQLFTDFDKIALNNSVFKLYTIGDCYVVLGMVDANDRDPATEARNVVTMAFEMIKTIRKVRRDIGFQGLDMRIGIHTGRIIGGIIGSDIVRFDIYGKDVLIANKMESNGLEGSINVSEETRALLETKYPEDFIFEFNKEVNIQAINETISSYFVYENIDMCDRY